MRSLPILGLTDPNEELHYIRIIIIGRHVFLIGLFTPQTLQLCMFALNAIVQRTVFDMVEEHGLS